MGAGGLAVLGGDGVLEVQDERVGAGCGALGELALTIAGDEEEGADHEPASSAAGRLRMKAARWQEATSTPSWL